MNGNTVNNPVSERSSNKVVQDSSRRNEKVLILVSVLTFLFIAAELVGGYLGNSLAIMTDAFHMMSDLVSFLLSILAIRLGRRKPNAKFSFGFQRAEVLGALISVLIIWALTGVLIYLAVMRIIHRSYNIEPNMMMITAGVGVGFNILIGCLLHFAKSRQSPNTNSKDDISINEGYPEIGARTQSGHQNLNIRAAFIHVLGDLVQSVGVLIAAVVIKFTGFKLADPICTFVFGLLVVITTLSVLKDVIFVLMEAVPSHVDIAKLSADIVSVIGVLTISEMQIWSLNMDTTAISVHLNVSQSEETHLCQIAKSVHKKLKDNHGFTFVSVQIHPINEYRMTNIHDFRDAN
ncbi:cation efflux family domain-containing protein [Ditylenchus destructor]|uniref:Cation efflux family domain-containing protein n=1 Tax=Ditylenchus destructor TaxID=166010 RepID=A0AAD4NMC5_9BILA|nr:cation efflux family domain-containing protein [Ditylenchus destructor]